MFRPSLRLLRPLHSRGWLQKEKVKEKAGIKAIGQSIRGTCSVLVIYFRKLPASCLELHFWIRPLSVAMVPADRLDLIVRRLMAMKAPKARSKMAYANMHLLLSMPGESLEGPNHPRFARGLAWSA